MNKKLNRIFDASDKRVKETSHLLARLYRQLLQDLNITASQWDQLTNRFYHSRFSRVKKNARDIASDKNNFNRALAAETISWKNFFKALCIMGPEWMRIEITTGWRGGKEVKTIVETKNPILIIDDNGETDDEAPTPKSSTGGGVVGGTHMSLRRKLELKKKSD